MSELNPPKSRLLHSPLGCRGLTHWKQALRDAPDLRWEKVQRVRDAIRRDAYDDERIIDRLIDRFEDEVGVFCRDPDRAC